MTTNDRVLIISAHPLFQEGMVRLLAGQAEIVGAVAGWEDARRVIDQRRPDTIIVEHADAELKETDLMPLLWDDTENLRVIYVTLADHRMTVHERRQVVGASEADLLIALKGECH